MKPVSRAVRTAVVFRRPEGHLLNLYLTSQEEFRFLLPGPLLRVYSVRRREWNQGKLNLTLMRSASQVLILLLAKSSRTMHFLLRAPLPLVSYSCPNFPLQRPDYKLRSR